MNRPIGLIEGERVAVITPDSPLKKFWINPLNRFADTSEEHLGFTEWSAFECVN